MTAKSILDQLISDEKSSLERPQEGKNASWERLGLALSAGTPIPVDVPPPLDPSGVIAVSEAPASGAGAGASTASSTSTTAASTAVNQGIFGAATLKVTSALLLVLGTGVGLAVTRNETPAPKASSTQTTSAPDIPENQVTHESQSSPDPIPVPDLAGQTAVEAATPKTPKTPQRKKTTKTAAVPDSSFDSDLAQLRRAQSALASGKNEEALSILNKQEAEAQPGQFSEDKEAVRTLALCREGSPQSKSAARAFLRSYPNSVYEGGIRSTCLKAAPSD